MSFTSGKDIIDNSNRSKEIKEIDSNRLSINRLDITTKIQKLLSDTTLDEHFIVHARKHLADGQLINIAEYCQRKASVHKGRAFVKICTNVIAKKNHV